LQLAHRETLGVLGRHVKTVAVRLGLHEDVVLVGVNGGTLADGASVPKAEWSERVCKTIKDDSVNGGYQGGCCAGTYPPF